MNQPIKSLNPIKPVKKSFKSTIKLMKQDGRIHAGTGLMTGVIALFLSILCLLGVLAFHFPQYLTTPELRKQYNPDVIRHIMFAAMVVTGTLSILNILFKQNRAINFMALLLLVATIVLGGSHVPVKDFPDHTPYIGLDWFILDLLGSSLIFIIIEKIFPLYKGQSVFRKEWQTDLVHFAVNHFIVGLILLMVNFAIHRLFGWMILSSVQAGIQQIPYLPQLLLCILVADLVQYWTHRAYHEVPFLWKFHAVHHSAKTMDWLAGSRLHLFEIIFTRVGVLGALYVLGFEKTVMDAYIIVVGFQAVLNHSNVHLPWGPLKYFIVTPDFHHWHHSSDDIAIDKNYAAHYAFLDHIFGTAIKNQTGFPQNYGVQGDYMPEGYVNHVMFPFRKIEYKDDDTA